FLEGKFKISTEGEEGLLTVTIEDVEHTPKIIQTLTEKGIKIYEARPVKTDLEHMFLSITNN
ncbi:MAG: hypothetical protein AAF391_01235, partial [Bacteroidota bacterium]